MWGCLGLTSTKSYKKENGTAFSSFPIWLLICFAFFSPSDQCSVDRWFILFNEPIFNTVHWLSFVFQIVNANLCYLWSALHSVHLLSAGGPPRLHLSVWVVWARWRRDGLTPGLPQGKTGKTGDGGEIDMCPPDVLLGVQRWVFENSEEAVKRPLVTELSDKCMLRDWNNTRLPFVLSPSHSSPRVSVCLLRTSLI